MQRINPNEPYYSVYNEITNQTKSIKLKGSESVIVDYVAVDAKTKNNIQKVSYRITFMHLIFLSSSKIIFSTDLEIRQDVVAFTLLNFHASLTGKHTVAAF